MKKRKLVLALMLSLMMLVTMIPSFSFADETGGAASGTGSGTISAATSGTCGATGHESDVTWSFDESSGTLTISGTGAMADYTVDGTGDDRPWKVYAESITKVQISEGVTSLGKSAFQNLTALQETNIPASITKLGDHIYRGDAALTTVNWAKGFMAPTITDTDSNTSTYSGMYVPTSMFDGCTSLGADQELSAWLPESFTGVGCAAFRGTAFKVDFEKWTKLSYIGAYGFAMMPNLDAVTVKSTWQLGLRGDNKTSCAFKGSGAKNVVIELRENIPLGLFQDCASLTSVTLSDNAKTIEIYAFAGTTALESIDLKNVETISDYAFSGCGIKKLVFPKKLRKVGGRAFSKNEALTELIINSSDLEIQGAFMGCSALSYVETSEGTNVRFVNSFGKGSQTGETACEGVRKLVANGTIDGSIKDLTGLKELTVNGSSKTGLTGTTVPDSVETLTITGDQWQMGGYVFAQHPKPKNLVVTAKKVTPQTDAKATFRSNLTLETAQFTGDDVTLNQLMFSGCSKLKQLDLSKVKKLAIGSGCFGDDTNTKYTGGSVNPFNTNCNIYVDSAEKVNTVRTGTGLKANSGIVLVVNGGTVEMGKTGFDSVTKENHYAEWYEDSECKGDKVTAPEAGKTYYAKWVPKAASSISVKKIDDKTYTGNPIVLSANDCDVTGSHGDITFSYQQQDGNGNWSDLDTAPSNAGTYRVKATVAEDGIYASAESECVEFTINKATPKYDVPNGLEAIEGQTLADVTLPEGFTWDADEKTSVGNPGTNTFTVTYTPADTDNYKTIERIKVTLKVHMKWVALNEVPVINAEDKTLTVGDNFDPKSGVTATDKEDGDLTDQIEIVKNTVDTSKAGLYSVTYEVTDKDGASVEKSINVVVKEKTAPPTTVSQDGSANGSKTGDAMPIGMLAVLMLAAVAGVVFCGRKLYKSR
ncbi:MAG: leucine-rich repeat protein [Clostridia bacterium]